MDKGEEICVNDSFVTVRIHRRRVYEQAKFRLVRSSNDSILEQIRSCLLSSEVLPILCGKAPRPIAQVKLVWLWQYSHFATTKRGRWHGDRGAGRCFSYVILQMWGEPYGG